MNLDFSIFRLTDHITGYTVKKALFVALGLFWIFSNVFSQESILSIYESANHSTVPKYQFDKRFEYLVLASNFSKDEIKEIPFTDRRIFKIDLVYTTFSETAGFDQKALDMARIERLVAINPEITVNKFFDWNIVGQTGCKSANTCLDFFHGFVVYYEPYYTKETSKHEIDSIKLEMSGLQKKITDFKDLLKVDYERIDCEYPESYYSPEYLSEQIENFFECDEKYKGRVFFDARMDYHGRALDVKVKGNLFPCKEELAKTLKYILKWKRGLVIGRKQYDLTASGFISFPLTKESVSITTFEIDKDLIDRFKMLQQYSQCVAYETDTSFVDIIPKVDKRVVSEVLLRNNWNPSLIVVDVTGSMFPYTSDMLKWIRLTTRLERDYVFFNDGDDKPTTQKVIGKTGGLYHVKADDYRAIRDKMFEAMRAGGGGDFPENNIEALLYGVDKAKPEGEIIMIADNYSFPRDVDLLQKYKGKMRIILCQTDKGINTKYLDLARRYGFTLHTLKTDIRDLQKNELFIEGHSYYQNQGKFLKSVKL